MIRAQIGENQFLFGIAEENVRRLKAGEPVVVRLNEFGLKGPPITIIILYGETEEKLALELRDVIRPDTKIVDHRSNRRTK